MQLFYTPDLSNLPYELNEEEARHCSQVLRLKAGEKIFCTDGEGHIFESVIVETDKKKTIISVIDIYSEEKEKKFFFHIAIAPTKNSERFEWFLEKAVEIGVDEITPLICEHSERKAINLDRSKKIMISAIKQSLKSRLPKINNPVRFIDFIGFKKDMEKFVAYCGIKNAPLLIDVYKKNMNSLVLIGPEGDFSSNEIEMATANGFTAISLGNSRFRTETAGIFVCSLINIFNQ